MSENKLNFTYVIAGGRNRPGYAHTNPRKVKNGAVGDCGLKLLRYHFANTIPDNKTLCPTCAKVLYPTPPRERGVKLSEKKVLKIRELYATGRYLQVDLAMEFNVSVATISHVVNQKTWSNI